MTKSPPGEADINELFNTHPDDLDEAAIQSIVDYYREGAKRWREEDQKAKSQSKRADLTKGMKAPPPKLEDLDL